MKLLLDQRTDVRVIGSKKIVFHAGFSGTDGLAQKPVPWFSTPHVFFFYKSIGKSLVRRKIKDIFFIII